MLTTSPVRKHGALLFRCLGALLLACACQAQEAFVDIAGQSGLDFVHFNGMSGSLYSVEILGSGAALLDHDNDGDLDVYLVQGSMLGPGKTLAQALFPPAGGQPPRDRLFRNDLQVLPDGSRRLSFTDVTAQSLITGLEYGMGAATGDYDNDGWTDLYVTNWGPNRLWRNRGDGTFEDVTARSGTADERWSTAASWFDYDRDGWLDLYVGNYVDFSYAIHRPCQRASSAPDYCGPKSYRPQQGRLLHNRRDGTFEDVTAAAGLGSVNAAALGSVATDVDGDGWLDLYVANDAYDNQLWMNLKDGRFTDEALLRGCAVDGAGRREGSMGVDAADFDGDGDEDLFVTNLFAETITLYVNNGQGLFEDATVQAGLAAPSYPFTGFGALWFDHDNDGALDLLVVNGAVTIKEEQERAGDPYPLHETNQLYRNRGDGRYEEITARAGKAFELSEVSRGAAFGDIDNDGDTDVLVLNNSGPPRLLENRVGQGRPWIGFRLVGATAARDMLGARVGVFRASAKPLWRRAHTDGSYLSASDPRVLVGLGDATQVEKVRVEWPDGQAEEWTGLALGQYHTLIQGGASSVVPAIEPRAGQTLPLQTDRPDHGPTPTEPAGARLVSPSGGGDGSPVPAGIPVDAGSSPAAAELAKLEPAVREQLELARDALDALREKAGVPGVELGEASGELGMLYQAYALLGRAEEAYAEALRLQPEEFRWPYYLGRLYQARGEMDRAAAALSDAVRLRPDDVPALLALGQVHLELGRPEKARESLGRALEKQPGSAAAHFELGRLAAGAGDAAGAARHFEEALRLQPAATNVHLPLAAAYRALGQEDRAREHAALRGDGVILLDDPLMADLERLRTGAGPLALAGYDEYKAGRFQEAARLLLQALERDPANTEARLNLGATLLKLGDRAGARLQFEELLRRAPDSVLGHFNLGTLLAGMGEMPAAIGHYRDALRLDPNERNAHLNLANALLRTGAPAEALEHYRWVLAPEPLQEQARRGEGVCLFQLGRHEESRARLEEGNVQQPQSRAIAEALARFLATCPEARLRDGARALELAQQVLQAESSLPHVETLAMAHAELGQFEMAVQWQRAAIDAAVKAGRPDLLGPLRENLGRYERGEPCRDPWPLPGPPPRR